MHFYETNDNTRTRTGIASFRTAEAIETGDKVLINGIHRTVNWIRQDGVSLSGPDDPIEAFDVVLTGQPAVEA